MNQLSFFYFFSVFTVTQKANCIIMNPLNANFQVQKCQKLLNYGLR